MRKFYRNTVVVIGGNGEVVITEGGICIIVSLPKLSSTILSIVHDILKTSYFVEEKVMGWYFQTLAQLVYRLKYC